MKYARVPGAQLRDRTTTYCAHVNVIFNVFTLFEEAFSRCSRRRFYVFEEAFRFFRCPDLHSSIVYMVL